MVLYTRIGANINPLISSKLAELTIKSTHERDDGRDGISYLLNAKRNNIETALSESYEAKLKSNWTCPRERRPS
jgi:hypothetical protein